MINITFPDGSVRQYESGVSAFDIAQSISPRLAADVLAATVVTAADTTGKGTVYDVTRPITEDAAVRLHKWEDAEAKHVFWHSSSHLLAAALEALYPGVKFGIGPAIETGFYYDVDFGEKTLVEADLKAHYINYNENPVDRWCFSNSCLKVNDLRQAIIIKTENQQKIDGSVTLVSLYEMYRRHRSDYRKLTGGNN